MREERNQDRTSWGNGETGMALGMGAADQTRPTRAATCAVTAGNGKRAWEWEQATTWKVDGRRGRPAKGGGKTQGGGGKGGKHQDHEAMAPRERAVQGENRVSEMQQQQRESERAKLR